MLAPKAPAGVGTAIADAIRTIGVRHVVVLAVVLIYPWVATPFFAYQIGGQALALGLIALSLTFLGGYGGMVSLAQMSIAGLAGYMVAIIGVAGEAQGGASSLGWPWWIAVPIAIAIATLFATFVANRFWEMVPPERFMAANSFFEHIGLIGGFVLVAWHDLKQRQERV